MLFGVKALVGLMLLLGFVQNVEIFLKYLLDLIEIFGIRILLEDCRLLNSRYFIPNPGENMLKG